MTEKQSTVLIYGTNLAGYRAAYTLAKMGYKTVLLNRGRYVDEFRNQALAQLPLDFCWACGHMPQRLFIGLGAMQVFYNAELLEVTGTAGNFHVKFKKKDQYVNNLACTECEACIRACPVEVETENGKRKAIYVIPEIAWENIFLIDEEHCTKCKECEKVCPTGALKVERPEEVIEMDVGAVILALEYEEPTAEELSKFAYSHPNVVKNSDLARKWLLTNFVKDSLRRKSDGKLASKIAIIVTPQFNEAEFESYNLSVNAIYRAYKIKELLPDTEVVVYMRDFKGFGKGHYRWLELALEKGVVLKYVNDLEVEPKEHDLLVKSRTNSKEETFEAELVILVTGQRAPSELRKLKNIFDIKEDEHGFCWVRPFTSGETNIDGVFAVGEFTGPKGNPEIIWEGYGVAAEIGKYLGTPNFKPSPPPSLRDVSSEEPRVGVFICSCFGEFERFLDLKELTEKVKNLPHVHHVEVIKGCCTPPTMQDTASRIRASGVNRVVLAVCTPLQKLLKFRRTVMMAGLNPLLAEFVRLREDVIRVHQDRDGMMEKAVSLIASAVEKVRRSMPAPAPVGAIKNAVAVIGGGAAGLETARLLAERGVTVYLVEREDRLGGLALNLKTDLEGRDVKSHLENLIKSVEENQNIHVFKGFEVVEAAGTAGKWFLMVENKKSGESRILEVGAVVIATGAEEFVPRGLYFYGEDPRVMTQRELEKKLEEGEVSGHVVMIQCVGSRNKERPYCSRVCCSQAIKNALALREKGVEVTILYRDLNTYGFKEDYRKKALNAGVKFIRFDGNRYPVVEKQGDEFVVKVFDVVSEKELEIKANYVVLSVGIVPRKENSKLAALLGFELDKDGFFDSDANACPFEEAIKRLMKPFELSTKGVFAVGLAHSPRSYEESLLTAKDAAGKILTFITKPQLPPPNAMFVSAVKESKCTGCGMCVTVCPYHARSIDEEKKVAVVTPYLCDSCGACLVACPSEAAYLRDARAEMMIPSIDALLS